MEVVALRDIEPGEEITHACKLSPQVPSFLYIQPLTIFADTPPGYTYEERKRMIKSWGFTCRCSMCTAPPSERALSDQRRERIFEIHDTLRDSTLDEKASLSPARIDRLVREALDLIELEELDPQLVVYHMVFARAYMMVGDFRLARRFIELAEEKWILYGGEEHDNIEGIRELWAELKGAEEEAEEYLR